jgi:hypothetical protein
MERYHFHCDEGMSHTSARQVLAPIEADTPEQVVLRFVELRTSQLGGAKIRRIDGNFGKLAKAGETPPKETDWPIFQSVKIPRRSNT